MSRAGKLIRFREIKRVYILFRNRVKFGVLILILGVCFDDIRCYCSLGGLLAYVIMSD